MSSSSAGIVDGTGQFFWACPQAYQQVFLGDNNTIWIEAGAIVGVYGNGNTVTVNSLDNIIDQGSGTTVNVCDVAGITFDLTDAPSPGCLFTGVNDREGNRAAVRIDQAPGLLLIRSAARIREVDVFDGQGRMVLHSAGSNLDRVSIEHLRHGVHVTRIRTEDGISAHSFLLN